MSVGPKKCMAHVTLSAPVAVHSSFTTMREKLLSTAKPRVTDDVRGEGGSGPSALA